MKTKINLILLFVAIIYSTNSFAHCEIPCGIYGDSVRTALIAEHISTIEKSMIQINELSAEENINYNQLIRWVVNKEEHANKIQDIVSQYFLHQRIKPTDSSDKVAYEKYTNQLILLHELSIFAMKSKQTTDLIYIEKMRVALESFEKTYFHTH